MRALILVLALAACGAPEPQAPAQSADAVQENLSRMPHWQTAREAGVEFRAVGQEPGWLMDLYAERIALLADYGELYLEFPRPAPATTQDGAARYETQSAGRTLTITIRQTPCEDVMSGEAYASSVEIVLGARALAGCGRAL